MRPILCQHLALTDCEIRHLWPNAIDTISMAEACDRYNDMQSIINTEPPAVCALVITLLAFEHWCYTHVDHFGKQFVDGVSDNDGSPIGLLRKVTAFG